jgi:Ca2+-binding RTX toxin-like protein
MAIIIGTNKSDRNATALIGTADLDLIKGLEGDDQLFGEAGNDILEGGAGNDELSGGTGNDILNGGNGNDILDGGEGNDVLNGGAGDDQLIGGLGKDTLIGGIGDDVIDGGDGNDIAAGGNGDDLVTGGEGDDAVSGGAGADELLGGAGDDAMEGGANRDYLDGGEGDDALAGGAGRDVVLGKDGDDRMSGGAGGDTVLGGAGNDALSGDGHNDYLDGGEGGDYLHGGAGRDMVTGGDGDDVVDGGGDDDGLLDDYGDDVLLGGAGNDSLASSWGNDLLRGGAGADRLISWSDAGEPVPAQDTSGLVNAGEPLENSDDIMIGDAGADTFWFHITIDAKQEIIDRYTDANTGRVDWKGVTGENGNVHDHWVESIGDDTIIGFSKKQGDRIAIEGHTVEVQSVTQVDANGDGKRDYTEIVLISQQGAAGAHDEDQLGTIKVYGDKVTAADIHVHAHPNFGIDTFEGRIPVYGTLGDDRIADGSGSQVLYGGDGDDTLIAYGDAGEPVPDQDANGQFYDYEPSDPSDDVLIGGHGADTFLFKALLNAQESIIAKHIGADGQVDWEGVAGENGAVHNHWVEGIGNDVIFDFSEAEGDRIVIAGHTVSISVEHVDTVSEADQDTDADYTVITLRSDQGGAGAHDGDPLGTITVYGDLVDESDIEVCAEVHYGIEQLYGIV